MTPKERACEAEGTMLTPYEERKANGEVILNRLKTHFPLIRWCLTVEETDASDDYDYGCSYIAYACYGFLKKNQILVVFEDTKVVVGRQYEQKLGGTLDHKMKQVVTAAKEYSETLVKDAHRSMALAAALAQSTPPKDEEEVEVVEDDFWARIG